MNGKYGCYFIIFISIFIKFNCISADNITKNYDCTAYDDYEKRVHCGNDGYLIKYGKKNCNYFTTKEVFGRFDEKGKNFIRCTKKCLIDLMDEIVNEEEAKRKKSKSKNIDCPDLKELAFKSHVDCYIDCGFCTTCKTNKYAFARAYDWRDFLSIPAMKQVIAVLGICGPLSCFQFVDHIKTFIDNVNILYN